MTKKRIKITAYKCHCEHCGYDWTSLLENPVKCAGCGSPNWNKPRQRARRKMK